MKIRISAEKSMHENASFYFDESKKAKAKAKKVQALIDKAVKEIEKVEKEKPDEKKEVRLYKKQKRNWFEKFHWFFTSDGFLAVAGRDKKSNEMAVKKHLEAGDLYFHAEIVGAAHCILKNGLNAPELDLLEAAVFAGVFSKAWTLSLKTVDVYSVRPEQVSKKAPSKQFLSTGEFMVYGKRNYFKDVSLNFALGVQKENGFFKVISGPVNAVKTHALAFRELVQGNENKSSTAKKLQHFFRQKLDFEPSLDELIRMIPEKTTVFD